MQVECTPHGLFVLPVTVQFKDQEKTFKALVDTGSNICACAHTVPVAFHAKPTAYKRIESPATEKAVHTLGYSMNIGFDSRLEMFHLYRLPLIDKIDLILGTPFLSQCEISIKDKHMEISWKEILDDKKKS